MDMKAGATLHSVGSADPCDRLEELEMDTVDLLNSEGLADRFAEALAYEKYRKST